MVIPICLLRCHNPASCHNFLWWQKFTVLLMIVFSYFSTPSMIYACSDPHSSLNTFNQSCNQLGGKTFFRTPHYYHQVIMAQPDTNIQNAPTPPKQPKYPLDTIPPSTKRKRSQFSRSPPTPCRGPNTQLPDIPLLETSPLSTTDTNFPPFHAQVQAVTASAHNSSASQSDTGDASISASIRSTDHDGQMRRLDAKIAHQHALREGPHDLPPIAVLHGTSVSVGGQSRSPSLERLGMYILPPNATVRQVKDEQPTAPTSGPLPKSAGPHLVSARASGHGIFGSAHRWPSYAPNTSSASGAPAPYTIPAARTRAETGASSHEPTPRYTYGAQLYRQNSLMRRAPPPHAPQGAAAARHRRSSMRCVPRTSRVWACWGARWRSNLARRRWRWRRFGSGSARRAWME
ncbi:hypothetical protein B0H10DRAFT_386733 [Mycena sp. CBHHK59/15]|nr:hypothetical protein B0H10DRAFT_386733 [Mycena sp. CBHHK59/15]